MKDAKKVGNTTCPTCGDKIDPKTAYQVYHKGKLVNLCCEHCLEEFSKDPDKYLAKAEGEAKTPKNTKDTQSSTPPLKGPTPQPRYKPIR